MLRRYLCVNSAAHRKMYAASRLLTFDEYCKTASRTRGFLVLLLFCTPAVIFMILFDCIPLQDSRDGWQVNVTYWLRISVGSVTATGLIVIQLQVVIPELVFTRARTVAIAVGMSAGYTGSLMLLAAYWKFPIPFTYTVARMPMMTIMDTHTRCGHSGNRGQDAREEVLQVLQRTQYPGNDVDGLPGVQRDLRHARGRFAAGVRVAASCDQAFAQAYHTSVDFFDALYMTKCMQSAGTLIMGAAIILVDMVLNYAAIRGLARQTRALKTVKEYAEIRENDPKSQGFQDVLRWVADILVKNENCDWLAIRPRKNYVVPARSQQTLDHMQSRYEESSVVTTPTSSWAVVPVRTEPDRKSRVLTGKAGIEAANKEAVIETACLLHESEAVVVAEHIETLVPVVYAIYIAILFHLSNAKYYKDMETFTEAKLHAVVINILIYAFMELLSLLYVYYTLKHHFGISVFYQLAFALESE